MFTSLRTGTKLILLCTLFLICVAVTTYSLVVEKQIAIAFARKELTCSKFLAALRPGLFYSPNQQIFQSMRRLKDMSNDSETFGAKRPKR